MELRKFEAPTLAEALQVIKRELGPEAVIISTKSNRSGLGLMAKASVEVTAAVSVEALDRKHGAESRMSQSQKEILQRKSPQKLTQSYDILSGRRLDRELNTKQAIRPAANPYGNVGATKQSTQPLAQKRYIDIQDDDSLEEIVRNTQDRTQLSSGHNQASGMPRATAASLSQAKVPMQRTTLTEKIMQHRALNQGQSSHTVGVEQTRNSPGNGILTKLLSELIDAGVEAEIVRELGEELKVLMIRENLTREDMLRVQLARVLMSRVRVARPLGERLRNPNTPRVITFVGPTGVGKTTTIAKIAAELVIHQKQPVTLATTDTFKIAAIEQLQTYANILNINLEVCPSAEALSNLGGHLGSDEVILVDTAGYGPRDERKLHELREILSGIRMETHLCLAATTRDRDLYESIARFKMFDLDYVVVTKTDETNVFGNIFNLGVKSHLPFSYFTMGQRVPEDMEIATRERIADMLLKVSHTI